LLDKHGKASGKIIIRADSVNSSNDEVNIKFQAVNLYTGGGGLFGCCGATSAPFVSIFRQAPDGDNWFKVKDTES
jgi:hypothetical protein